MAFPWMAPCPLTARVLLTAGIASAQDKAPSC
jgi:hypothetical protein